MFDRVLIANRGEVAVRICRTLRELGIESFAIYADDDHGSRHVDAADHAICLGSGRATDTYLNIDKIVELAARHGIDAIHPGYGFLSENASFVERLDDAGVTFIGPRADHIRTFGLKHVARDAAGAAGVATLPGSELLDSVDDALRYAAEVRYPLMLKSSAGGGGIGMHLIESDDDLEKRFDTVQHLAASQFGDSRLFLERYIAAPRHVEVQAFGDGRGAVLTLGDRDCSLQRRHQKVIEECPAPNLPADVHLELQRSAERLLASVDYMSAGTVEFLYDPADQQIYFLEVNTRLQVEHGVTEEVYGVDIVRWMVELAAGDRGAFANPVRAPEGHAIEARVYAEDPFKDFQPAPGFVAVADFPADGRDATASGRLRVDTWLKSGIRVSPQYDPMIGKVIAHASTRESAIESLDRALEQTRLHGIADNLEYARHAIGTAAFKRGEMSTHTLADLSVEPTGIEILDPGPMTTIQSYPGRRGFWSVGVPPSGPMDDLSFRLGNRALDNDPGAVGLEMTISGIRLRADEDVAVFVAGHADVLHNEALAHPWQIINLNAGDTLSIGRFSTGARAYLLVRGGFDVPDVLGSPATFTLGRMGGIDGGTLKPGTRLALANPATHAPRSINPPRFNKRFELRCTLGPHPTAEFFTDEDIETIFRTGWKVHFNSSRTGIRLTGPHPTWARPDGGQAGLHPSNIHDNAYAFGTIDFTGDMPVVLGPDGPSLGGFVCPATVINADRWKLGQLVAGDEISFVPVDESTAIAIEERQNVEVANLDPSNVVAAPTPLRHAVDEVVLLRDDDLTIRRAGQDWLLIEVGALTLDIRHRMRIETLNRVLEDAALPAIRELTPGVRSLQVHFDSQRIDARGLVREIMPIIDATRDASEMSIPSRVVHLPLSWDDPVASEAAARYLKSVRADAPWGADNIEFIRRINGLDSRDDVHDIVFDASYLVLGLGDVYLGAPVATPLDPRHRLVTTKYNPARTWTAENSVGIGGSYLCIYGMEGPGGYQLFGRTIQVWNTYRRGANFDEFWLLRPFDQIRFYPVEHEELEAMRADFPMGRHEIEIETTSFSGAEYQRFLETESNSITAFEQHRQRAFKAELADWRARGVLSFETDASTSAPVEHAVLDAAFVSSPVAGSVWSIAVEAGSRVESGQVLFVLESMKAEFEIKAPHDGVVGDVLVAPGELVEPGQVLAVHD